MKFPCPQCGESLNVKAEMAGKKGKCPSCKEMLTVPAATPAPVESDSSDWMADAMLDVPKAPGQSSAGDRLQDLPAAPPQQTFTPPSPVVESAPQRENFGVGGFGLIPAVIGASIGAALAAGIWVVVAVFAGYEIGWLAVLVGAAAGWGAALLSKEESVRVGLIAAVIGGLGVVAGSYTSFEIVKNAEITAGMAMIEAEWQKNPNFRALSPEEKQDELDAARAELDAITYFSALEDSPKDIGFLVLFGALGLYYGYRVGSGQGFKKHG